jgi:hypothetical protein
MRRKVGRGGIGRRFGGEDETMRRVMRGPEGRKKKHGKRAIPTQMSSRNEERKEMKRSAGGDSRYISRQWTGRKIITQPETHGRKEGVVLCCKKPKGRASQAGSMRIACVRAV